MISLVDDSLEKRGFSTPPMSATYAATGIVLAWSDHWEADRRYSLFTREYGKIEALARGSHKPLAKLSPHLEMPAELQIMFARGRQYELIIGVNRMKAFPTVCKDLSRLLLARNALHLVDIGLKPHEPDPVLYDVLMRWLAFLDVNPSFTSERSGFLLASFALKLLSIIGYRPQLTHCLSCKSILVPGAYRWHALKGGVVCRSCTEREQEQWFASRAMTDEALKLLRYAMENDFASQLRLHLSGTVLAEFHEAVESLIISHFPTIPANSLRAACFV